MTKRLLLLLLAALTLVCLAACQSNTEPPVPTLSATPEPTATVEPTPTPTPTPTPVPTPTPTPVPRVLTNGRILAEGEEEVYRPILVSIENSSKARPQVGLNQADIVYEFSTEYSVTRFQVLFNDTLPIFAGPVRSTRYYFVNLEEEWDGMYAHEGYGPHSGEYVPKFTKVAQSVRRGMIRVNADTGKKISTSRYYWRSGENKATEHTLMLNVAALVNQTWGDYVAPQAERWLYQEESFYENGKAFKQVKLPFLSSSKEKVIFVYDETTNKIGRIEDGETFMTRTPTGEKIKQVTTEPLSVQNLILQYAPHSKMPKDSKGRLCIDLFGTGKCDYVINGQHVTGYWERASIDDYTRYYTDDGNLVVLEPGNTWIVVYPDEAVYPQQFEYR